jgi:hypothetical protein
MTAHVTLPATRQGGDGDKAIREKLRKLIEEAKAVRAAGAG